MNKSANDNQRGRYLPTPAALDQMECVGCGVIGVPQILCFSDEPYGVCASCAGGQVMTQSRLVDLVIG